MHQAAWLPGLAAAGHLTLGGAEHAPTLRRLNRGAARTTRSPGRFCYMFAGRAEITLGAYDSSFGTGWHAPARHLKQWQADSGQWDPAAVRLARPWASPPPCSVRSPEWWAPHWAPAATPPEGRCSSAA
ncbi:hypothetical protein [Streptomyces sp. NPDC059468]|uniref:hypothetical protein n=1 Tax=Streptomyces sp. NPDC059468 TaxID=3346845 RepID=UPI0036753222